MRKILFDTEQEEARVATETQIRQQQERIMSGMGSPQNGTGVMPTMPTGFPPFAMHHGMMYAPGTMAPMMMMNPAMFMQAQQQPQQGATAASSGNTATLQPTMQPVMIDPYQQAAMFQSAFMANPAMMMSPMMQFQQAASQPVPQPAQPTATPPTVDVTAAQASSRTTVSAQNSATAEMNADAVVGESPNDEVGKQATAVGDTDINANDDQTQNGLSGQQGADHVDDYSEI